MSSTLRISGVTALALLLTGADAFATQAPKSVAKATAAVSATPTKAPASNDPDLALARKAALDWLAVVDTGKFEASFDEASAAFQKVQKKPDWAKGLSTARAGVGRFISRTFLNDEIRTALPNLPPGKYITVRFKTTFAKYATASESVTLVRDGARGFRTVAYFLG